MYVIRNERVWCFDVDDTLVLWGEGDFSMECPYTHSTLRGRVHEGNVRLLKEQWARGSTIVVWSQGGFRHAEAVVNALGIEAFVHYVQTKPCGIVDDLAPVHWLPATLYMPADKKYKGA